MDGLIRALPPIDSSLNAHQTKPHLDQIPTYTPEFGALARRGRGSVIDEDVRTAPGLWGPRAEALAEALERELPPLLWARVVELVSAVEDHATEVTVQACDHRVARVLAYFPSLTPAWHAVSAHLESLALHCCGSGSRSEAQSRCSSAG